MRIKNFENIVNAHEFNISSIIFPCGSNDISLKHFLPKMSALLIYASTVRKHKRSYELDHTQTKTTKSFSINEFTSTFQD